jgi:Stage II sporulation protein E (SpoIIE)
MDSRNSEKGVSPWQTTPPKAVVVFLLAVFFVFTTFGFVADIMDMGRQAPLRYGVSVLLSGLFAVCYATTGITLKGKFWKGVLPLCVLQFVVMGLLGRYFPDAPESVQTGAAAMGRLQARLTFDGIAIIVAVCLGYVGFLYVSISEGRRHIRAQAEKAVLEAEMAAARAVQQMILPEQSESFPGYTVETVYRPALQVGGDFFQVLPAGKCGLLIVVGDVAGKGLPAALLVSLLVGSIRATAEDTHDPVLILRKLHDRLMGRTCGGFSTALAAHIADDGLVTIANAGHLSPYLDGREVEIAGALPLGIIDGGQYETMTFVLQAGSRLTFYSDGVVEAQNETGELFGFERAKAISMEPAAAIVEAAVRFGQSDDITVVTIERLATSEAADAVRNAPLLAPV